jgi:choline dehydrogenase-like flavoprotein
MGTLRMGADPTASVVNPDGRFHDVDNLYACDGSVFPTSSGWNPTLTIIAMALRIAHGMAGTAPP